ncbi:hypothetical protein N7495_006310 [Penicillium taxi]|uniref:uncharacterized protein n=1 Tax=Penicillium taxi TaxID=168475 RepID=UPI0025457D2D|nr:uncharacterized protein N7495_006310 [Penicillium taxi]KAJ5894619.1 hypothetical protein N7495_006310 [Penicillium taxi]
MSSPKVVVITGGNGGLGYETVKALLKAEKPYHIFLGSRSPEKGKAAIATLQKEHPNATNTIEAIKLDLISDEDIENAFEHIKTTKGHIDILINNAGATWDIEYIGGNVSLREAFNQAYNTNVTGTNVLTATFIPLLIKSAEPRLIFVAGLSNLTQAAENYFPTPELPAGWPKKLDFETIGYRCSKTALNMLMLDWNHKLKADGVKVCCFGPGMMATNLGGNPEIAKAVGGLDPAISGGYLKQVVKGKRDAEMGKIIVKDGICPW